MKLQEPKSDRDLPLMKCGHTAQSWGGDGDHPACVICIGIDPGAEIVEDNLPDLSQRTARCAYYNSVPRGQNHSSNYGCKRGERCMCEQPSVERLPFFEHKPEMTHDQFYCGCWGWN
jgi:hypothetical protein